VALLLFLFLAVIAILTVTVATPRLLTQARRAKEEEMIWRGEQYVRAIRLFYLKNGRLPAAIEDLTKPKTGIRFLRRAYADPMNGSDGSWRFIYMGPLGQILGSTRPHPLFPMGGLARVSGPTAAAGNATAAPGAGGTPAAGDGASTLGASGSPPAAEAAPGQDSSGPAPGPETQATGLLNDSQVFGANIIGIGSKVDKYSLMFYKGAKNYKQFEFIWDPSDFGGVLTRPPILAPRESSAPPPVSQPNTNPQGVPPGS